MKEKLRNTLLWWLLIAALVLLVSVLHYTTSTMKWQYHLIYMQSYFIPILIAAFQFGLRGGLGTALAVSLIYFPHVIFQWGGLVEGNLMRYLQIVLFNVVGIVTGIKSDHERRETELYLQAAAELQESLNLLRQQSGMLEEME
ncbi:MAG: sensor histidine kinase, partial [Calditrichia bacterium]